jgi:hypothetical protein
MKDKDERKKNEEINRDEKTYCILKRCSRDKKLCTVEGKKEGTKVLNEQTN